MEAMEQEISLGASSAATAPDFRAESSLRVSSRDSCRGAHVQQETTMLRLCGVMCRYGPHSCCWFAPAYLPPLAPRPPPLSHDTYTRKQGCGGSVKLLETWDPRTVCHQAVTKCNSQMQLAETAASEDAWRKRKMKLPDPSPTPLV